MPRTKDLTRHPVKYLIEFLEPILKQNGDEALFNHVHFAAQDGTLKGNCHDEATMAKLKSYQSLIPDDFINSFGLQKIIFRLPPQFMVYKILESFEQSEMVEFSLAQLMALVDPAGEYSIETIKGILRELTVDLDLHPDHRNSWPPWLIALRSQAPMVIKLKPHYFKLFRKPKIEKAVPADKKAGSKKAKRM